MIFIIFEITFFVKSYKVTHVSMFRVLFTFSFEKINASFVKVLLIKIIPLGVNKFFVYKVTQV